MSKLALLISFILFFGGDSFAQFTLRYQVDPGEQEQLTALKLDTSFAASLLANTYLAQLPGKLQAQGYVTSSIDSIRLDSLEGFVQLYLGERYDLAALAVKEQDRPLLEKIQWPATNLQGLMNFPELQLWQQRILDYLDNTGHPFGKVWLDSIGLNENQFTARLNLDPGPAYKVDSIRVYGDVRISNEFLQRYLRISNGSAYDRSRLNSISKKIAELNFVEEQRPADLSLLGSGSILNLYLKQRRVSQAYALIGLQPNSSNGQSNKLLLTVDANLLLRNSFGSGETIGLVWQQLQQGSPRLNILFDRPYMFHSPFGLNFSLDMYRKDSTFLNIMMNLGTHYQLDERQTAGVFLQRRQSIISSVDTNYVRATRTLPTDADVVSLNLGFNYGVNNTDYRLNPRKGNELTIEASGGNKQIRKNSQILELKDPLDPNFKFASLYDTVRQKAYQVRFSGEAAHFFPLAKQSTVRLAVRGGLYQSARYYRNEFFRIGGFKTLRGFDEESQFVNQYALGTLEYRYRLGINSYFFVFSDGGWASSALSQPSSHTYISGGTGISLEMKAGIINLAWAVGKRDDVNFNLRQSKVHIGFVSYF